MKTDKPLRDQLRRMHRRCLPAKRITATLHGAGFIVLAASIAAASPRDADNPIRWDAKNAYRNCDAAIDRTIAWPSEAKAACVAMLMCANEAVLSAERHRRLIEQIRQVPGCGLP